MTFDIKTKDTEIQNKHIRNERKLKNLMDNAERKFQNEHVIMSQMRCILMYLRQFNTMTKTTKGGVHTSNSTSRCDTNIGLDNG